MEQEGRRHDVLAAGQDVADLGDVGESRRVEHAVGVLGQDRRRVLGRQHADGVAPEQRARVHPVLVVGIDLDTGQFEAGPRVQDRRE
jgi:hypothetical protein